MATTTDQALRATVRELVEALLLKARQANESMDAGCYERARDRRDFTFTLVGQDRSSPRTIAFWIMENIETAPAEKLVDALCDAINMRQQPNRKDAD